MRFFNQGIIFFATISLMCVLGVSYAGEIDDGFRVGDTFIGEHFTVNCAPGVDSSALARTLDVSQADRILTGSAASVTGMSLTSMLDTLFARACNVLDMQLYSYTGKIKVCSGRAQLNGIYNLLFKKDLPPTNAYSFYVFNLNTIYITSESFTLAVLAHEIGHAIVSNYFVVQPSVKIQEVLAGYVEYQLRKTTQ